MYYGLRPLSGDDTLSRRIFAVCLGESLANGRWDVPSAEYRVSLIMEGHTDTDRIVVEWLALQTRITTFHPQGVEVGDLVGWWSATLGESPEVTESRPREQSVRLSGALGNGLLTVNNLPGRTDFVMEPTGEGTGIGNPDWPVLAMGSYRDAASSLVDPVKTWIMTGAPVYRLALGALLLLPAADLRSVYQSLSDFLPTISLDGISTPDFLFRINRARASVREPSVLINRLAGWSTAQGQGISISGDRGELTTGPVQYAAHLELDINTHTADGQRFDQSLSVDLLDELVDLGYEIAHEGDKP